MAWSVPPPWMNFRHPSCSGSHFPRIHSFYWIPTGYCPIAQGCDNVATLGMISAHGFPTPKGLRRSCWHNPFGVKIVCFTITQGSGICRNPGLNYAAPLGHNYFTLTLWPCRTTDIFWSYKSVNYFWGNMKDAEFSSIWRVCCNRSILSFLPWMTTGIMKRVKNVECSRIFRYMLAEVIVIWNKINCSIFDIRKKLCLFCFFPFDSKDDKLPKPNYQHDKRQRELEKKKKKEEKKHRKQTTEDLKPEDDPNPVTETDQPSWMPGSCDHLKDAMADGEKNDSQALCSQPFKCGMYFGIAQ